MQSFMFSARAPMALTLVWVEASQQPFGREVLLPGSVMSISSKNRIVHTEAMSFLRMCAMYQARLPHTFEADSRITALYGHRQSALDIYPLSQIDTQ